MNYLKLSEFFDAYFYWIWPLLTNIGEFCIAHESTLVTFLIGIVTLYLACYAIAWAKYEFHITRQSQQVSVLSALCTTEDAKRINFAPSLSHMTQKKLPKYPTLITPSTIILDLFRVQDNEKQLMEYNFDTIDTVSNIIRGYDNWEDANFSSIILNEANLEGAELEATFLKEAYLKGARLAGAHLEGANLEGVNLQGAHLEKSPDVINTWGRYILKRTYYDNKERIIRYFPHRAPIGAAKLTRAILWNANLEGANLAGVDLSGASLIDAHLEGANLTGASLEDASLRGAFLERAKLKEVCLYSMTNDSLLSGNGWGGKINDDITDQYIFDNGWSSSNGDLRMVNDETTDPQLIQKCVELLSPAKTLFEATLPKPVEKVLRERYPHLFEPPA